MPSTSNSRSLTIALSLAGLGILLPACADSRFATLSDGACRAFPRPEYQVKGKTFYDQLWADKVTEAGVTGCKWERPAPRPAALDMPVKATPLPKKKPSLLDRWRGRK